MILDLIGDGVRLTDYGSAPVLFDADNDGGSLEETDRVSNQDGLVVLDRNGRLDNMMGALSEYYRGKAGSDDSEGTKPYRE